MSSVRRARGTLLRLVRRRPLSVGIGLALLVPAGWVEFGRHAASWWAEGAAVVAGATGAALVWAGLMGTRPDWVE